MNRNVILAVVGIGVAAAAAFAVVFLPRVNAVSEEEIRDIVAAANYCAIATVYRDYFDAQQMSCQYSAFDRRDFSRITCASSKCVAALKGE